jgi:hypothetical protein
MTTLFNMKYCVLGQKKLFNNFIMQFDYRLCQPLTLCVLKKAPDLKLI